MWCSRAMGRASEKSVVRLSPGHCWCNNLRQIVHTLVPLSPSNISRYWCKNQEGNGRLWKRCGLTSITPSVSSLPAQDQETEMSAAPVCHRAVRGRCWLNGHITFTACKIINSTGQCEWSFHSAKVTRKGSKNKYADLSKATDIQINY